MILENGIRIDLGESESWPLSIDLKITEKCYCGCPWCHESSNFLGKHGDIGVIKSKLTGLPSQTEIAIGGGNPLLHPKLQELVSGLGCIVNMTVRDRDLESFPDLDLTAIGISISEDGPRDIESKIPGRYINTWVSHLILGLTSLDTYRWVKSFSPRILWLGYKNFGRGKSYKTPEISKELIKEIVRDLYFHGRYSGILAFDNLALSQLDLKSRFLESELNALYQGPEFSRSMYVDGVKGMFAPSSTSEDRVSWDTITLKEYYVKNHRRA